LAYNSDVDDEVFFGSWNVFFDNTKEELCPVTECFVLERGCTEAYSSNKIKITGNPPNGASAVVSDPKGYMANVCFKCVNA